MSNSIVVYLRMEIPLEGEIDVEQSKENLLASKPMIEEDGSAALGGEVTVHSMSLHLGDDFELIYVEE